jgi:hypothetical protein
MQQAFPTYTLRMSPDLNANVFATRSSNKIVRDAGLLELLLLQSI